MGGLAILGSFLHALHLVRLTKLTKFAQGVLSVNAEMAGDNGQGLSPRGSKAKVVPVLLPVSQIPGAGISQSI